MSKINRHIALLFTFLASLSILIHSFVPHDHHYDSLKSNALDMQLHSNSDHQTKHLLHCHFLNQTQTEKHTLRVVKKNLNTYSFIKVDFKIKHPIAYYKLPEPYFENKVLKSGFCNLITPTRGSPNFS